MTAERRNLLVALLVLGLGVVLTLTRHGRPTDGTTEAMQEGTEEGTREGNAERGAEERTPRAPRPGKSGYEPRGPTPAEALPGGSLTAHEGGGGHTVARHVGRTLEQLRERLNDEGKREASTFRDLATADRAVAAALFAERGKVRVWLAEGARGDHAFTWRSPDVVGQVLRAGASGTVPGRTVQVVLYGSARFPEGFAVRTAYVRTP